MFYYVDLEVKANLTTAENSVRILMMEHYITTKAAEIA